MFFAYGPFKIEMIELASDEREYKKVFYCVSSGIKPASIILARNE